MEARLKTHFHPVHLVVTNDSAAHAGHRGDDGSGESHFAVELESESFRGLSRLERQRAVNRALSGIVGERIHALIIRAHAPGERPR